VFVVRLTPTAYPATLQNVQIYFGNRPDGLPAGTSIGVLVGISPTGGSQFSAALTSYTSSIVGLGQFNTYPLTAVNPPITANSGDFIVGFEVNEPAGVFPADLDVASTDQGRSYSATLVGNSLNFTPVKGNLGIRATVKIGP
jgi:hypothetical protein